MTGSDGMSSSGSSHGHMNKAARRARDKDADDMLAHMSGPPQHSGGSSNDCCFPVSATVYTKHRGTVSISQLRPGELVFCGDANTSFCGFSPFIGYLHYEPDLTLEYLEVETSMRSTVTLSAEHFIFAATSQTAKAEVTLAAKLNEKHYLCHVKGESALQRAQIVQVTKTFGEGAFCPCTQSGTIVVDGHLCSCYASSVAALALRIPISQEFFHLGLLPLRLAYSLGLPLRDGRDVFEKAKDSALLKVSISDDKVMPRDQLRFRNGIHPIVRMWLWILTFFGKLFSLLFKIEILNEDSCSVESSR